MNTDIIEGEVLESKVLEIDNFSDKMAALKDIGIDPNTVKLNITNEDNGMSKLYNDPNYLKMMMNKYSNIKSNKGPVYTQKSLEKRTEERRIKNKRAAKARRK